MMGIVLGLEFVEIGYFGETWKLVCLELEFVELEILERHRSWKFWWKFDVGMFFLEIMVDSF
jgi:hypothetical protein